jgi:hypothetical protein
MMMMNDACMHEEGMYMHELMHRGLDACIGWYMDVPQWVPRLYNPLSGDW